MQEVAGTLLYYARAVDSTILPALSAIATEQANPTEKTKATIKQLLDYCATQDEAVLTYKASNMILAACPMGAHPLLVGDMNFNFCAPRTDCEEAIAEQVEAMGLDDMSRHFHQRSGKRLRGT